MIVRTTLKRCLVLGAALAASLCGFDARAAKVDGYGSVGNLGGHADIAYEHPTFLHFARLAQLTSAQLGGGGTAVMSYIGHAQFGRLGASSRVGGNHPTVPTLPMSSDLNTGFQDLITAQ